MSFDRETSVQLDVVLGRVQAQMRQMISDQLLEVDKMVENALTPQMVSEAFAKALATAFQEELDDFFRFGDGKKLVRAAIQATGSGLASQVGSAEHKENLRTLLRNMRPEWTEGRLDDEVERLCRA